MLFERRCLLQMVLQSSRTLADLAEQTVIPADYLYTLIVFFMFMVRHTDDMCMRHELSLQSGSRAPDHHEPH